MKTYLHNIWLWLRGFRWLWTREVRERDHDVGEPPVAIYYYEYVRGGLAGEKAEWGDIPTIVYKPGWSPLKFLPVYLLDHGAAVILLGIGVQPISRWAGERIDHRPWRWLARLLNRLYAGHTAEAGGLLWGSQPCREPVRHYVLLAWICALGLWIAQ